MLTTNPGEEMGKLGQKIAKSMAILTQTGQGSSPSSAPGDPQECGHGWGHSGRGTPSFPSSWNNRDGPGHMILAYSLPTECGVESTGSCDSGQGNCGPSVRERVQPVTKTHSLFSVLDARVGPYG